jgi:hypothetical protein
VNPLRRVLRLSGFDLVRMQPELEYPADFEHEALETIRTVREYTMTSPERLYGLVKAVEYLHRSAVPGAIVECGVWRGGSMMAAAATLLRLGDKTRDLFLFDTFTGMPAPADADRDILGRPGLDEFARRKTGPDSSDWCRADVAEVRANMLGTGYPGERVRLVRGKVEQTIPAGAPEAIALLRLDTDWYESTRHELTHLYPRLSVGGVLIVDDYGYWTGARRAVDEYLGGLRSPPLLMRLDESARVAVRCS